jgi:hypothetical protein
MAIANEPLAMLNAVVAKQPENTANCLNEVKNILANLQTWLAILSQVRHSV